MACARESQVMYTTAGQSGFGSHFGLCLVLPFSQFFFCSVCCFYGRKRTNTQIHNANLLRPLPGSMVDKIQGLFKEIKDFSRMYGIQGLFKESHKNSRSLQDCANPVRVQLCIFGMREGWKPSSTSTFKFIEVLE